MINLQYALGLLTIGVGELLLSSSTLGFLSSLILLLEVKSLHKR